MARKPKGPAPGEWTYTVGEVPVQLTAYERTDRGLDIYTRVWDGARIGQKKKLCGPIRDAAGKVVPGLEIAAQQAAVKRQEVVAAARVDPDLDNEPAGPLSLAAGFRKLLHPTEGKYPSSSTHATEVKRAAVVVQKILGGDLLWSDVRYGHYRKVWRTLARENAEHGTSGPRWAEVVCEVLASAARWLQQEELIEPGDAEPARGWKQAMRKEWAEITDRPVQKRRKPRHTPEEKAKLWGALPHADPRLALAVEIGAELRLGQVVRTRRSDVHASPDGTEPLWMVRVHGRGKKHGEDVVLTPDQREALSFALSRGYLADLEAARHAGAITDYYLFPGRKLVTVKLQDGRTIKRARANGRDRHLDDTGLGKQWAALEKAAKVTPMPGRRWYGMRRRQADDVDALEDVRPVVKNRTGGWTKTSTREGYLEGDRLEDAVAAAEARRRVRPARNSSPSEEG
jgi:hypothetical protein